MPIEILQKEVQVRDPTTHQFSDLAALRGGQGPQGQTGPGVPAGGTDGDLLVKNGNTDYAATWEKTPPQMGTIATIETSPATHYHAANSFLVYNGALYQVSAAISPGDGLVVGSNIRLMSGGIADYLTVTGPISTTPDSGFPTQDIKVYRYGKLVSVSGYVLIPAGTYSNADTLFTIPLKPRDYVYAEGFSGTRYAFPVLFNPHTGEVKVQDTITVSADFYCFLSFFYFTNE